MKTGDTFEGQLCYGNVAVKDKVFDVAVISRYARWYVHSSDELKSSKTSYLGHLKISRK